MEKINFKNKGETGAVSINAENLNLLQENVENEINNSLFKPENSYCSETNKSYSCNYINSLNSQDLKISKQTYYRGSSNQGLTANTINSIYFDSVTDSNNNILKLKNGNIAISKNVKMFIVTISLKTSGSGFYSYIKYNDEYINCDDTSRGYWTQTVAFQGCEEDKELLLQIYPTSYLECNHDFNWSKATVIAIYE